MHKYGNPRVFMGLADRAMPILFVCLLGLLGSGLYLGLIASPPDYIQGESVRIMYVHVPSAWMAMAIYTLTASCSAAFLIWRNPFAFILARSAAGLGAAFTLCALITGALWGKPTWGTYWVWDARLTSFLVLFLMYLGFVALSQAFSTSERGMRPAALLAVLGIINLPIIKWSVTWWHTLHQPASVLKLSKPTVHASMLTPLLIMGLAFTVLFLVLWVYSIRLKLLHHKVEALLAAQSQSRGPHGH